MTTDDDATLARMTTPPPQPGLDWALLSSYAASPFPPGWSADRYVYFSPVDHVHNVLIDVIDSAAHRIMVNMYGYDDEGIDSILHGKAADPAITFLMNLDRSQAGGVHEKALLQPWASAEGTSVAVGTSAKHAISHLKVAIIDGLYVIGGSTNWSLGGESAQDNELILTRDPLLASRYESILLANHVTMLKQMAAPK